MAKAPIQGLHHVTSMASDPDETVRFLRDVLGLRLVKQTVNFDDVTTYHLYFGNETGEPGTALTIFPFGEGQSGTVGAGQVETTAFHVPTGSLDYWADRLDSHDVDRDEVTDRFGEQVLGFRDGDGLRYELVASDASSVEPWAGSDVPTEHAICGFHSVTLALVDTAETAGLLQFMGYEQTAEEGAYTRFETEGDRATIVDLHETSDRGQPGLGTVHHVAFRVPDDDGQFAWREALSEEGYGVTEQKDRQYFRSIYFRERGGILFEFATDGPGFTADESVDELGETLKLPEWLEGDRERIESSLSELTATPAEVR
ncbi:ring-cleaving dioxygenase [Halosegnis rubeus]|jgi:glyoxalase family protein|uniref:Ring-cleaving dioxygenase n=1 Tax=Halosegnis rubeus TaxID=2212850 RepID=A0A5N5U447_9EURY|nr:ring-cleaving dioxygenase [Halosegnis rubeus]KAB7513267.1 ring-cleaving dioxygenase [Halosegnis rubeus]KAB7517250.1 ring-cleaving dioxygenase [Halosegnis rubeus]